MKDRRVGQFILGIRIMRARRMLSAGERVSAVAYEVALESPSHFASVFHRLTGISPLEDRLHSISAFPTSSHVAGIASAGPSVRNGS